LPTGNSFHDLTGRHPPRHRRRRCSITNNQLRLITSIGINLHAVSMAVIEETSWVSATILANDLAIDHSEPRQRFPLTFSSAATMAIYHRTTTATVTIAGNQIIHISHNGVHVVGGNDTINHRRETDITGRRRRCRRAGGPSVAAIPLSAFSTTTCQAQRPRHISGRHRR